MEPHKTKKVIIKEEEIVFVFPDMKEMFEKNEVSKCFLWPRL